MPAIQGSKPAAVAATVATAYGTQRVRVMSRVRFIDAQDQEHWGVSVVRRVEVNDRADYIVVAPSDDGKGVLAFSSANSKVAAKGKTPEVAVSNLLATGKVWAEPLAA